MVLDISETELPVPTLVGQLISVELVNIVDASVEPDVELKKPSVVCKDVSIFVVDSENQGFVDVVSIIMLDVESDEEDMVDVDDSVEEVIPV